MMMKSGRRENDGRRNGKGERGEWRSLWCAVSDGWRVHQGCKVEYKEEEEEEEHEKEKAEEEEEEEDE